MVIRHSFSVLSVLARHSPDVVFVDRMLYFSSCSFVSFLILVSGSSKLLLK